MATNGGPRGRARARSRAKLEEGASSEEETRALNAREIRVARRRRVVEDREQRECEDLDARLHVWQQTMARREASRTLSEGEAERQAAAAMQVARNRVDPIFFSSDEEDASSPARKRSEPLTAFEVEEEVRRSSQRDRDAFVAAVDKAASNMMSTPVSAPTQSPPSVRQTQLESYCE